MDTNFRRLCAWLYACKFGIQKMLKNNSASHKTHAQWFSEACSKCAKMTVLSTSDSALQDGVVTEHIIENNPCLTMDFNCSSPEVSLNFL